MKRTIPYITIFILLNIINSCKVEDEETLVSQGYVIGFDPCKKGAPIVPNDSIRGLLIEVSGNYVDTLLTYNLPWALFNFPDELFESYKIYYFFPNNYQRTYKLKLTYRFAKSDETQAFACGGDIFAPNFEKFFKKQIIILSTEKLKK